MNETARECAERLVGVRWTPKSGWPTEVEFLTGTLVDSITSALEEREREIARVNTEWINAVARSNTALLTAAGVEHALKEKCDTLREQLEERERERDRYLTHLRNLLARIHKDGGHYTDAVGIDRACQDADVCIIADRSERDTLKAELDRLRAESAQWGPLAGEYDKVCFERNTLKVQLAEAVRQVGEVVSALENCERHVGLLGGESAKLRVSREFLARVKGSEWKEGAS